MTIHAPGMLYVASDVSPEHDADFNAWYDQEHVEERARIEGFVSAARYEVLGVGKRYLGLYRTQSLEAFTTPAYRAAFGQQTPWSITNLDRMLDPMRRVCAVTASVGEGTGSFLSVSTMALAQVGASPEEQALTLGRALQSTPGFVRSYLLQPDALLSTPLPKEAREGRRLQPLLVIESSSQAANEAALAKALQASGSAIAQSTQYALKWKLYSHELAR
jgi:hypothetical protein